MSTYHAPTLIKPKDMRCSVASRQYRDGTGSVTLYLRSERCDVGEVARRVYNELNRIYDLPVRWRSTSTPPSLRGGRSIHNGVVTVYPTNDNVMGVRETVERIAREL